MDAKKSRNDWVKAGFRRLAGEGIDGVRVEPLAKELQVTKGSFYWHFKNREELLKAMLEHWRESATHAVIVQSEKAGSAPSKRMERLLALATDGFDGRLEMAIRNWSSADALVQTVIDTVDSERLSYLRKLLREAGFTPAAAEARAFAVYSILLGNYLLTDSHGKFSRAKVLADAMNLLTKR